MASASQAGYMLDTNVIVHLILGKAVGKVDRSQLRSARRTESFDHLHRDGRMKARAGAPTPGEDQEAGVH